MARSLLLATLFIEVLGFALAQVGAEELLSEAAYLVLQDLTHQDLWLDRIQIVSIVLHGQGLLEKLQDCLLVSSWLNLVDHRFVL